MKSYAFLAYIQPNQLVKEQFLAAKVFRERAPSPKGRRLFLKRLSRLFLSLLGGIGLFSAIHYLPRPPKKVLVKEKLSQGQVLIYPDFFLVMTKKGALALFRRCPHLGCPVTYDPREEKFVCPCHQSQFTLNGRYLAGPAKKDLKILKIQETKGGLIVEIPG